MSRSHLNSSWFTRGWTLQELLAPSEVLFLDRDWMDLGTRHALANIISAITNISRYHLRFFREASIAQKLSWASRRDTTRREDMAYSLMGLFDVNMPLLVSSFSQYES